MALPSPFAGSFSVQNITDLVFTPTGGVARAVTGTGYANQLSLSSNGTNLLILQARKMPCCPSEFGSSLNSN